MIRDLFSHKIHSSGDDWPDKLVELAAIFNEFDGEVYDRTAIEERLMEISPRAAYAPRDRSKFRDEISAYPAYLGLYHLHASSDGWRVSLSQTTRELLVREEPDVASFMRLQMVLFQYPNGMGAVYRAGTSNVHIQANSRDRMLQLIRDEIHLSPLRLIVAGMLADAEIRKVPLLEGLITYEEIFALANDSRTNRTASPSINSATDVLRAFRNGEIERPTRYERRFHILKHTDLFKIGNRWISFRTPVSDFDEADLNSKVLEIRNLTTQFTGFDSATNGEDLARVVLQGTWCNYFDGLTNLSGATVKNLTKDIINEDLGSQVDITTPVDIQTTPNIYPFTDRQEYSIPTTDTDRNRELADPEITRIKRQKRNLAHKLLIDKMCDYLTILGATPKENPHIDLYAEIPTDGSFLFEMKSGGENFLDQIRKGISQLYEYRFRYKNGIRDDTVLCLVIPDAPNQIPWLCEYLCKDRGICLCWFTADGLLESPVQCKSIINGLMNMAV